MRNYVKCCLSAICINPASMIFRAGNRSSTLGSEPSSATPCVSKLLIKSWGLSFSALICRASKVVLAIKNLPANARDVRDSDSIPGGGHGNPLQYYCLENPKDRGAWQTLVHRVQKSRTGLKWLIMYALICKVTITLIYLVIILITHSCIYSTNLYWAPNMCFATKDIILLWLKAWTLEPGFIQVNLGPGFTTN